jgi:hypothetical protein
MRKLVQIRFIWTVQVNVQVGSGSCQRWREVDRSIDGLGSRERCYILGGNYALVILANRYLGWTIWDFRGAQQGAIESSRVSRFTVVSETGFPLVCSCRKFYLASRPGLSIRCLIMLPYYLSILSFLRRSMAPNLAPSQHDLIRDIILNKSLTIYFASG